MRSISHLDGGKSTFRVVNEANSLLVLRLQMPFFMILSGMWTTRTCYRYCLEQIKHNLRLEVHTGKLQKYAQYSLRLDLSPSPCSAPGHLSGGVLNYARKLFGSLCWVPVTTFFHSWGPLSEFQKDHDGDVSNLDDPDRIQNVRDRSAMSCHGRHESFATALVSGLGAGP